MLVVYLEELKLSNKEIGLMFTLTLLGDMFISLVMTRFVLIRLCSIVKIYLYRLLNFSHADRWGRRRTLIIGAFLSIITGVTFSFQQNFWWLLISAIVGVISPSVSEQTHR